MSGAEVARRANWKLLGIWGLVAAVIVALVPTTAEGTEHEGPPPVEVDAGVILLSTGPNAGDNWIRYYADPSAPLDVSDYTAHQDIDVSPRCEVQTDGSILGLTANGQGLLGEGIAMVSNGLGTRTKNNCSTRQGRINEGHSLTFALATSFDSNVFVDLVEVDVEGKFGTDLGWSTDVGEPGREDLSNSSDNGPDSGVSDNEIAEVNPEELFREITFAPTDSEVAIEGGGDGTIDGGDLRYFYGVNQTLFKLVEVFDGVLDCGDTSGPTGGSVSGWATEIDLWRGNNIPGSAYLDLYGIGDKPSDLCNTAIPFTFRIEENSVLFDAGFELEPQAHFIVRIAWTPGDGENEYPVVDPDNPPPRLIDFGDGFEPRPVCVSQYEEGSVSATNPLLDLFPEPDDIFEHPVETSVPERFPSGIVPWCSAHEQFVLLDSGLWQQITWYDGAGDPNWR